MKKRHNSRTDPSKEPILVQEINMINNIEKVRQVLGNFQFSDFRIVREFRFYETASKSVFNIGMILESEERSPNHRLTVDFLNVRGVKIDSFGGGETRIIGFDIQEISKNQLEQIAWKISDYENGKIAFYAQAIGAISVDPI